MGLDVTAVFIETACDALKNSKGKVTREQYEELCDELIALTKKYDLKVFTENKDE